MKLASVLTAAAIAAASPASAMTYSWRAINDHIVIDAAGDIELNEKAAFTAWVQYAAPNWSGKKATAIIFNSRGGNVFGGDGLSGVIYQYHLITGVARRVLVGREGVDAGAWGCHSGGEHAVGSAAILRLHLPPTREVVGILIAAGRGRVMHGDNAVYRHGLCDAGRPCFDARARANAAVRGTPRSSPEKGPRSNAALRNRPPDAPDNRVPVLPSVDHPGLQVDGVLEDPKARYGAAKGRWWASGSNDPEARPAPQDPKDRSEDRA
jgi:hypothetical protein